MFCDQITLRPSGPSDQDALAQLVTEAFGRPDEAKLTLDLIAAPDWTLSLVAECEGRLVGQVLMSEIGAPVKAAALAPLSVQPRYRELQLGTRLVREAIDATRQAGFEAVFVLGDNLYYERFGFSSALADPFEIAWQGPHFMALELREGALRGKRGQLAYPAAFGA
ncbi:MAG: N-acetyltransferase [Pseudomonadota bacterium]|nr:N-acetyltransferase [Pseudomonadota bacterium]